MTIGMQGRIWIACAITALLVLPATAQQTPNRPNPALISHSGKRFDLAQHDNLQAFIKLLDEEVAANDKSKDDASEDDAADQKPNSKAKGAPSHKLKYSGKVLKEMRRTAVSIQDSVEPAAADVQKIRDMEWAQVHKTVRPVIGIAELDVVLGLFNIRQLTLNSSGRGNRHNPASNLVNYAAPDLSAVDPKPSSFWSRPADIAGKDLFHGFDRTMIEDISKDIVTYDKPHTGYGAHASIYVKWRGERWKCKFGEEHSEPFGCRIFWALGFQTYPTDYAPELKVRYKREILSQFNSRKTTVMHIKALGLPLTGMSDKTYLNPFDYIQYAVLKDASKVPAAEFRNRLFARAGADGRKLSSLEQHQVELAGLQKNDRVSSKNAKLPGRPEQRPDLYDSAFEAQIDYLVMNGVNLRMRDKGDEIGPWDFNEGDTPTYRETRGLGILNAWLDNWDVRWGNNNLELVKDESGDGRRLVHIMGDLGAEFGNSSGYLRRIGGKLQLGFLQNSPNAFGWSFTEPIKAHQESVPITHYMPIAKNRAFHDMNLDDARWMARLIGQLTEDQIKQGLIGSGIDSATGRLLLEKLVARRDNMIKDLGLDNEIGIIRPNGPEKRLTYDPKLDGFFSSRLPTGAIVTAPDIGNLLVRNGRLVKHSDADSSKMKLSIRK